MFDTRRHTPLFGASSNKYTRQNWTPSVIVNVDNLIKEFFKHLRSWTLPLLANYAVRIQATHHVILFHTADGNIYISLKRNQHVNQGTNIILHPLLSLSYKLYKSYKI